MRLKPRCCNFIVPGLICIIRWPCPCRWVRSEDGRWRWLIWIRRDGISGMSGGLIRISRRCLAFGRCGKGRGMSRCCCYGVARRGIVSRPKGRRRGSSSICLKPVSTMDPSSCWLMWRILPATTLSSSCAIRKISIGRLDVLLICVLRFCAGQSCCCRKSSNHAFIMRLWRVGGRGHWMWLGPRCASWFCPFAACCFLLCCLRGSQRWCRSFESLCWLCRIALASWWGLSLSLPWMTFLPLQVY